MTKWRYSWWIDSSIIGHTTWVWRKVVVFTFNDGKWIGDKMHCWQRVSICMQMAIGLWFHTWTASASVRVMMIHPRNPQALDPLRACSTCVHTTNVAKVYPVVTGGCLLKIWLVDFSHFEGLGYFPRFPESSNIVVPLSSVDLANTVNTNTDKLN